MDENIFFFKFNLKNSNNTIDKNKAPPAKPSIVNIEQINIIIKVL